MRKSASKDDTAILKMSTSLTYMMYMAAFDVLNFDRPQLVTLYEQMWELKEKWRVDELTTESMLVYCNDKSLNPYAVMKSVPQSQKLTLVGNNITVMALRFIEAAMLMNLVIATMVLIDTFKLDNDSINRFLEKVVYYVDSYTKRQPKCKYCYLNDKMIIEILRDEAALDIEKGIEL